MGARWYTKQGNGRGLTLADARAFRPHAKRRTPKRPDRAGTRYKVINFDNPKRTGRTGDKRSCGGGTPWQGNAPPSEGRSPSFRYYRQQDRAKPRRGGGSAESPFVCLYFAKLWHLAKFAEFCYNSLFCEINTSCPGGLGACPHSDMRPHQSD